MTRAVCDGKSYEYIYDAQGNLKEKIGTQAGVTLGGITSDITAGNNALDISYAYDILMKGLLDNDRNSK